MGLWLHQQKAIDAIDRCTEHACSIVHFCGTGKTRIIYHYLKGMTAGDTIVMVFPSIALITQVNQDYLAQLAQTHHLISVCSRNDDDTVPAYFTTDATQMNARLEGLDNKPTVIAVTYHSLHVVVDVLSKAATDISKVFFDEAHHVSEPRVRNIVWTKSLKNFKPFFAKQVQQLVFMTATPRNRHKVVMDPTLEEGSIDRLTYDLLEENGRLPEGTVRSEQHFSDDVYGHCGPIVSRFSHISAVEAGVCNDFELAIDFGLKQTNSAAGIMDAIVRCMLTYKRTRFLSFHQKVVGGVDKFTQQMFATSLSTLLQTPEFSHMHGLFKAPELIQLRASTTNRPEILTYLDQAPDFDIGRQDNELLLICSCRTINEGVNTRRAQGISFSDPRSSFSDIIQLIGRTSRKAKQPSIVLIPVTVDAAKYTMVKGDGDGRDNLIREDLRKGGDFNSVLNVVSALRQADPEVYNLCLFYPKQYAPSEVRSNLKRQGFLSRGEWTSCRTTTIMCLTT